MARGIYKVDMVGVHTAHKMHSLWLLLVALLSIQCARVAGLGCVDEQGQQVDWFIVYKFPYAKGKNNAIFSGYNYAYQVPDKTGWQLSAKQITDPKESILARTLNPVLGTQQKAYNTLFYSDQPPVSNVPGSESTGSSSSSMAHAKGVVATDAIKGFWLIHSVPSFVQVDKTYIYPLSASRNAQTGLCISLSVGEIAKVLDQLLVGRVARYSSSITGSAPGNIKMLLTKIIKHEWRTPANGKNYEDQSIKALSGATTFRSFYKSPKAELDLYSGVVAPTLGISMYVQTWRRNPGQPLESACARPNSKVENVLTLRTKFANSAVSESFDTGVDHSKWSVASGVGERATGRHYVCVGDLNRMSSQTKRGGGVVCIVNTAVWRAFHAMADKVEECNKPTAGGPIRTKPSKHTTDQRFNPLKPKGSTTPAKPQVSTPTARPKPRPILPKPTGPSPPKPKSQSTSLLPSFLKKKP